MNLGYRRNARGVALLAVTYAALITGVAQASEPIDISGLIGGLQQGCRLREPLKTFRSELNARYTFEVGSKRLRTKVRVPAPYVKAIGRTFALDRGEYTEIVVLLNGVYRGLHIRSLTFDIGHSNGVNVIKVAFDAAQLDVENIIGREVIEAQKRFENDPEGKDFGFSVRITPASRGSELICDTST